MSAPPPVISAELKTVLRAVKLGRCLDTLPERLALAKTRSMGHAEFLELVLADEVTRRETSSAALRARTAGLDPDMVLENWDEETKVNFDRAVWDELCSLRFVDAGHNVMIMGPVGVGKTFMASALGHAAVRRRYTVVFCRADVLLKRLRVSRLDNSHDAEMRKLMRVDLLDTRRLRPPTSRPSRHRGCLRAGRRAPPGGFDPGDVEPRTHRVDRPDGRRFVGPVRHRPSPVGGLRARSRR